MCRGVSHLSYIFFRLGTFPVLQGQGRGEHQTIRPPEAQDQLRLGGDRRPDEEAGGHAGSSGLKRFGRGTGQILQHRKHLEENADKKVPKDRDGKNKKFKKRLETILWKTSNFHCDVGEEPDFLIMVKDNLHKKNFHHSSEHAEQYICLAAGPIREKFLHQGMTKFSMLQRIQKIWLIKERKDRHRGQISST